MFTNGTFLQLRKHFGQYAFVLMENSNMFQQQQQNKKLSFMFLRSGLQIYSYMILKCILFEIQNSY